MECMQCSPVQADWLQTAWLKGQSALPFVSLSCLSVWPLHIFVHLCICLSIYLVYPSSQPIYLSVHLSRLHIFPVYLSIHPSIYPSIRRTFYIFGFLFIYLVWFFYPSDVLPLHLSLCLSALSICLLIIISPFSTHPSCLSFYASSLCV